jgi:hypothetical protein
MSARRTRHVLPTSRAVLSSLLVALLWVPPAHAGAGGTELRADLNGKEIELVEVANFYCHDFDFPRIHCFTSLEELSSDSAVVRAVTATNYLAIFENMSYNGAAMYVSEDYTVLTWIGWNDRISSFKALNSQSGTFHTDWFYGGTRYNFCCNTQVSNLGSFNDSFSSVKRT